MLATRNPLKIEENFCLHCIVTLGHRNYTQHDESLFLEAFTHVMTKLTAWAIVHLRDFLRKAAVGLDT